MGRIVERYRHKVEVTEAGLWVPLKSGHRLAARLWLPDGAHDQPVPALFEFLPYRKGDFRRAREESHYPYFAGHGYAVVRVDMRGSGDSFGVMRDEYEKQEQDDAVEAIEWIALQRWCNGRVGMFGISWSGFNSLQVAARRPPALRAIVTSCSTDDRYTEDMHYMGGCLLNDMLDWGVTFFFLLPLPGDPRVMGDAWRENWRDRLNAVEPPPALWMQHPVRDGYWKQGSINEDYDAIQCPVFAGGGWLDGYTNAVPRLLAHLKVPTIGLIGPHGHQYGFEERAPGPAYGFLQEALRWWDLWLKDKPTGIMDEPQLRVFMGDDVPAAPWYQVCPGRWVGETEWPSARIKVRTLFLNTRVLGDSSQQGPPLTHTSPQTVGLAGGEWCVYGTGGVGPEFPGDQRLDDAYSLTFDSDILAERIEILGAPTVELSLAVDRSSAFVALRLNDVKPDGSATRVTYGVLNLAHRDSHEMPTALEPGKRYTVKVPLNDIAYSFAPGHRIRISMSTTYWPMIWPSPEIVTLAIWPGVSKLQLPVRPLPQNEHEPIVRPLPPAEESPLMKKEQLEPAPSSHTITHDVISGRVEIAVERGSGYYRIEENEIEAGFNISERTSIGRDDPLSAVTKVTGYSRTGRAGSIVDVKVCCKLRSDRVEFLLESSLEVQENKSMVFERRWTHRFPRRFQ